MKTTFEMDGLFTPKDIDERYLAYAQCTNDGEYSPFDTQKHNFKCPFCGDNKYDPRTTISLRTYNPSVHNRKKKRK